MSVDSCGALHRRAWLAACGAGLAGLASCGRKLGTGFRGYALIATSGERSVSVIDLMQFRVLEPISLSASPHAVVPGRDGAAFVLTPDTGCVHRILDARRVAGQACLAPAVSAIRLSSDSRELLAISESSAELIVADESTFKVRRRFTLREKPERLETYGEGSEQLIATASGKAGTIELFRPASGERWGRNLGSPLGDLRFRADGQILLVANRGARSLTALSVPKLELIADLPLGMQPENLCFSRDQGQLFVSGEGMDGVAIVFPYRVLQVDQTVLAGRDPGVMACSENPELLFVASASGSDVCILRINTRKEVALVDVAQEPAYIAVTPDDQYALILTKKAGTVGFIRIPSVRINPAVTRRKTGGALFTMLFVGREPVHAAVVTRRT